MSEGSGLFFFYSSLVSSGLIQSGPVRTDMAYFQSEDGFRCLDRAILLYIYAIICIGHGDHKMDETLPKALRTQALTTLTSNFG